MRKELFTEKEFEDTKSNNELPFECFICKDTFYIKKKFITRQRKNPNSNKHTCCSVKCSSIFRTKKVEVQCLECNKLFIKSLHHIKRSPNNFCNRSCAALYNNKNRSYGYRRSKFEIYLEECIKAKYPNLAFYCNSKDLFGYELDFYFPSLKLAIEIQGIFHYKPIYGQDRFKRIKELDKLKAQLCQEHSIDLICLDISSINRFSNEKADPHISIILNYINDRI